MNEQRRLEPDIARIIAIGAMTILARSHPEYGMLFFGKPQEINDVDIERKVVNELRITRE